MNNTVVARNTLQEKMIDNHHSHLAPDPFAEIPAPCRILKVYDAETIEEEGISEEAAGFFVNHTGWLFAKVLMLDDRTEYILPFRDSEDLIYLVYGNRVLLEGRLATIHYRNQHPQNGFISLQRNHTQKHLPLASLGQTYDIGALV